MNLRRSARFAPTRIRLYVRVNSHRLRVTFSVAIAFAMLLVAAGDAVQRVWSFGHPWWEVLHLDHGGLAFRTLASVVATFDSVGLALVWVTGSMKPAGGGVHLLSELYRSSRALPRLFVGIVAIALCLAAAQSAWLTQTAATWAFGSMLLVLPVLAEQIEGMSPIRIANRLARQIRPNGFVRYQLADPDKARDAPKPEAIDALPPLVPRREPTETKDPLQALSEVVKYFVDQDERIGGRMALRIVLGTIASRHSRYLRDTWTEDRHVTRNLKKSYVVKGDQKGQATRWRSRRKSSEKALDDLLSAFHVLHFFVQRAETLAARKRTPEGGPDDFWRHMLVVPLTELHEALLPIESARQTRVLVAHALYRVALAFDDAEPRGRIDPLTVLFRIATGLWLRDADPKHEGPDSREARFLVDVAATIKRDTRQFGIVSFPDEMPWDLFREWDEARRDAARATKEWDTNPWMNAEGFRDALTQRRTGLGRPPLRPPAGWAGPEPAARPGVLPASLSDA